MTLITKKTWKTVIFTDENGTLISRLCTDCGRLKGYESFDTMKNGFGGKRPDCSSCYRKKNVKTAVIRTNRYRAKQNGLPSTMTLEQHKQAKQEQGYKCLLSHSKEVEVEHLIPLSWGTGLGDDYRNVVYMDKSLNSSKRNKNVFIWIKSQPHYIQRRFYNELIPLVAERNGMTAKEYEEYVNKCYEEYINKN
ncbi:hypothetical protein [Priestia megaterium]|uniref:hypothetical protein n=1 Tax=Priestia megaterium TaxID=1404 RepID=UPI00363B7CFF